MAYCVVGVVLCMTLFINADHTGKEALGFRHIRRLLKRTLKGGRRGRTQNLAAAAGIPAQDPDIGRNTLQLIASRGFRGEELVVTTQDGYLLRIHHIFPRNKWNGKVVVLQHGLMDTSATWVLNGPTESLGYILSDAGFEVYLANSRGSQYSSHQTLSTSSSQFWSFTWDDMGTYDVPATAQFVLSRHSSGAEKVDQIYWVGHSQGCAISFAGFLAHPDTAKKIAGFAALAPVTWLQHQTSPLMKGMVTFKLDTVLSALPAMKFVPSGPWLSKTLGTLCRMVPKLCDDFAGGLFGPTGPPNVALSKVQALFSKFPDGTSTRNIVHWIRNARSGKFADMNDAVFDVSRLSVPTVVYYGTNDMLGDPTDVQTLASTIASTALKKLGAIPNFSHMDFTWSPNAAGPVYTPVVAWFKDGVVPQ